MDNQQIKIDMACKLVSFNCKGLKTRMYNYVDKFFENAASFLYKNIGYSTLNPPFFNKYWTTVR